MLKKLLCSFILVFILLSCNCFVDAAQVQSSVRPIDYNLYDDNIKTVEIDVSSRYADLRGMYKDFKLINIEYLVQFSDYFSEATSPKYVSYFNLPSYKPVITIRYKGYYAFGAMIHFTYTNDKGKTEVASSGNLTFDYGILNDSKYRLSSDENKDIADIGFPDLPDEGFTDYCVLMQNNEIYLVEFNSEADDLTYGENLFDSCEDVSSYKYDWDLGTWIMSVEEDLSKAYSPMLCSKDIYYTAGSVSLRVLRGSDYPYQILSDDIADNSKSSIDTKFLGDSISNIDNYNNDNSVSESKLTIDTKKPVIYGVKNNKIYNKILNIKWSDSGSGIKIVTLDGKKLGGQGVVFRKNGTHVLKVIDNSLNINTVTFTLDTSKPIIKGVSNNKVYKKNVKIKFSDKVTKIKSAKLNGKSIKNGITIKATKKLKSYVLVVTDKAGNKKVVRFKVYKK